MSSFSCVFPPKVLSDCYPSLVIHQNVNQYMYIWATGDNLDIDIGLTMHRTLCVLT